MVVVLVFKQRCVFSIETTLSQHKSLALKSCPNLCIQGDCGMQDKSGQSLTLHYVSSKDSVTSKCLTYKKRIQSFVVQAHNKFTLKKSH